MALRILEFQFDEGNEREMAKHGVSAREVDQVLDTGFQVAPNKSAHAEQPYAIIGFTHGGRCLFIPIRPIDEQLGIWRPATAFDTPPERVPKRKGRKR
jgi:uncharacterized DUF497 family protein